jgi:ATP-dependent DNA helicase 2 subunit 1
MSSGWNPNFSDHDSEDEDDVAYSYSGRDAIVVLIDANATMFEEDADPEGNSNFQKTLKCIEALMLNKIVCSEKDLISVLLYNTLNKPDPKVDDPDDVKQIIPPDNCSILMAPKPVTKERIQFIKNLIESEDHMDFANYYGHSTTGAKMAEVLWFCSIAFNNCRYSLQSRTILHFTNIDVPHRAGSVEFQQAIVRAKDLQQLSLDYRLFPMKETFSDTFYLDFLCTIMESDPKEFEMPASQTQEEMIKRRIFKKDFKKRAQSHLKMSLGDGFSFGVEVFGFTRFESLLMTIFIFLLIFLLNVVSEKPRSLAICCFPEPISTRSRVSGV